MEPSDVPECGGHLEPDYTTANLPERAARAREAHAGFIADLLGRYEARTGWRRLNGVLALGVCGMGRAGKDTFAEYWCAHSCAVYPQSASWQVLPLVAHMAGCDRARAWTERHQHRKFWVEACHALRGTDYSFLVRMCLGAGDVAVGIRGRLELEEVTRRGIVGLTVWVDNPRVDVDPTVEYAPADCDLVVPNHGSLLELYARTRKLLRLFGPGRVFAKAEENVNGEEVVRTDPARV